MYGYWPTVGQTIGFDFTWHPYYWGHGFETMHSYYTDCPQEQVQGNPGLWGLLRFEE